MSTTYKFTLRARRAIYLNGLFTDGLAFEDRLQRLGPLLRERLKGDDTFVELGNFTRLRLTLVGNSHQFDTHTSHSWDGSTVVGERSTTLRETITFALTSECTRR